MKHEVAPGILTHMNGAREIGLQYLRGALLIPAMRSPTFPPRTTAPSGQAGSYLSDAGLRTREAVNGAVTAIGELGPDLKVRDLALWLEREQELGQAATLYHS